MSIPYDKLSQLNNCILNAYYNANTLIGYKLAYFRSSLVLIYLIVILCPVLRSQNLMFY